MFHLGFKENMTVLGGNNSYKISVLLLVDLSCIVTVDGFCVTMGGELGVD